MPETPGRPVRAIAPAPGPAEFRDLARQQGNLFLACYAEAHRIQNDEIPSMLKQFEGEPEEPDPAEPPPFVEGEEEEEEVLEDSVFGLAVELYHGAIQTLRAAGVAVKPAPAGPAKA